MGQQRVLVEAGCTQAEVLEITVVSGFVPAATSGSIFPWALSTDRLIVPLFFKRIFLWNEEHFERSRRSFLFLLFTFITHPPQIAFFLPDYFYSKYSF